LVRAVSGDMCSDLTPLTRLSCGGIARSRAVFNSGKMDIQITGVVLDGHGFPRALKVPSSTQTVRRGGSDQRVRHCTGFYSADTQCGARPHGESYDRAAVSPFRASFGHVPAYGGRFMILRFIALVDGEGGGAVAPIDVAAPDLLQQCNTKGALPVQAHHLRSAGRDADGPPSWLMPHR